MGIGPREVSGGNPVEGKVVSTTDYGVFVELEEGVEGLVHITEMSLGKKDETPLQGRSDRRHGGGGGP